MRIQEVKSEAPSSAQIWGRFAKMGASMPSFCKTMVTVRADDYSLARDADKMRSRSAEVAGEAHDVELRL
jgi:hypothetical protein